MPGRRITQATLDSSRYALLIDDNPYFQNHIKALLEKEGFLVICLPDHTQAYFHLTQRPFSLIITDDHIEHQAESFSGEVWCREYKARGGNVPVILVTGANLSAAGNIRQQSEMIMRLATSCGADWVIPKAIIQATHGDRLFLQYAKDLALDAQTARSIDSKSRGH